MLVPQRTQLTTSVPEKQSRQAENPMGRNPKLRMAPQLVSTIVTEEMKAAQHVGNVLSSEGKHEIPRV